MTQSTANWIHLDLKGAIPSATDMIGWVDELADSGYHGIVFEYEDRIDWQSWPQTFRAGYSNAEWSAIWARCRERGLEIVPLIQTMGHLEWLLRHDRYARFREGGLVDEICPSHPDIKEALTSWIDEVIALHPGIRHIHLGGDEVWQLCACGVCRNRAASHAAGKIGVYLEHMTPLLRHVIEKGVTPLIWADMFWPQERQAYAAELPSETILVDWQYGWLGATELNPGLVRTGRPVWAADAIRCAFDMTQTLSPLRQRAQNLDIWHRQVAAGALAGVIHTTWSRSSSFRPLYGPFEGWLPLIRYAADAGRGAKQPLFAWIDRMDTALYGRGLLAEDEDINPLREAIEAIGAASGNEFERRCCRWWDLALDYAALRNRVFGALAGSKALAVAKTYTGRDAHVVNMQRQGKSETLHQLIAWQDRASALWRTWGVSDGEEFFESRAGVLFDLLTR